MRNRTPQGAKKDLAKAGRDPIDPDRRQALKTVGRFAVYVSPAMTVLLKGDPVSADHAGNSDPGHDPNGQGRCNNKPWLSFC